MRVAVVHYHMRPGGVTRVICNSLVTLDPAIRCVVLAGDVPDELLSANPSIRVVPSLQYHADIKASALADKMIAAAKDALGGVPDVWHIHNHSLGKSAAFTRAVHHLAEKGHRLLLQLHDFAEDGRPENYRYLLNEIGQKDPKNLETIVYPVAAHVHYAVLNSRDFSFLANAGFDQGRLHLLPNPVLSPLEERSEPISSRSPPNEKLYLYPTRAIRRKNLGEFVLWSALAEPQERFIVTLAPTSVYDREGYERWVRFCAEHHLPVEFEAGLKNSYAQLIHDCTAMITTSMAEGFGLAFLEPWLSGKLLLGRNIPEITRDMRDNGLNLEHLYAHLHVPLNWLDQEQVKKTIRTKLQNSFSEYAMPAPQDAAARAWAAMTDGAAIDFGRLDEAFQEEVIRRLMASPTDRDGIRPNVLPRPGNISACVSNNKRVAEEKYKSETYGERLSKLYRAIAASDAEPLHSLNERAVLKQFLAPERFCLLRS